MRFLGIDTSNYTTSLALLDTEKQVLFQQKKLLTVETGQAGLRQSDAVFQHTRMLPELMEALRLNLDGAISPDGIGVSKAPRLQKGSYMPCFLAGFSAARVLSAAEDIPLFCTSHQIGHILAALFSAKRLALLEPPYEAFLAFHASGGTTDLLLCEPNADEILCVTEIARSLDLKAGQAIDRIGLMLGLRFPCGPALEELAQKSDLEQHMTVRLRDGCCSLSGLQNQCEQLKARQIPAKDIARYCLNSIAAAFVAMVLDAKDRFGVKTIVYAGGVLSNRLIRDKLSKLPLDSVFADPEYARDNAAGVAVYAACKQGEIKRCLF